MGGGNGCAQIGGNVEPDGAGQQRGRHQPHKDILVGDQSRVDDAFLDGADHVTASDQGSGGLENGGNQDRAGHGQGAGADRRSDIVGNVVGADVHRHVATDHRRGRQHVAAFEIRVGPAGEQQYGDDEQRTHAEAHEFALARLCGLLELIDVLEIHD